MVSSYEGGVWSYWCSTDATNSSTTPVMYADNYGTTSASTSDTAVWRIWSGNTIVSGANGGTGTISYHTTDNDVWTAWCTVSGTEVYVGNSRETPEQAEARARQFREAEQRRIQEANEALAKKKAAEAVALELLKELIGEKETKVFEETGRLFVKGSKHDYIVNREGRLWKLEKGKVRELCVHLRDSWLYPSVDNVIALKCFIEADEYSLLKKANDHGVRELKELPRFARAA